MAEQETLRCLEPDYAADFCCDGQRCGAACCRRHWGIYVDEETYGRYQSLPPGDREWVLANIEKAPPTDEFCQGPLYHGRLRFGQAGSCLFLGDDELCSLQRRLGESYLGATCALYPRHIVRIGPYLVKSLSLSCPVAAELAILREDVPRLVEGELSPERQIGWRQTACGPGEEGVAEAFMLLQLMSWRLLSCPVLPLPERLRQYLFYLDEADAAVSEGDIEALQHLAARSEQAGELARDWLKHGNPREGQLLPPEALGSLHAALAPSESRSPHGADIHFQPRPCRLPDRERLLENYLLAELYTGLYPCRLGGTLRHNGEAVYALAALAEEAINEAWASGQAARVLAACVRLSAFAGHDQDWLQALSDWVQESLADWGIR